jgi:hypothetical protein
VIVTVIAVGVVKVTVDEIVDVVAVRHCLVPTPGSMHVARLVPFAAMLRSAAIGIFSRHLDHMLVDVIAMRVMQVPVVQIVDVIAVAYRRMTATRPVLVCVIGMVWLGARCHETPP